ncbi:hypothetical protein PVL29_012840 [Vitis rotundifolia]|uniref:Tyrosinase copper-binding domain-containing protein n=1 Tax=Vitis rotundifolia TaxID=103349 RepID=A0AA38ZK36_VITRO|nr:hypothetical protein PVL29_012840 [Vitis rotundifolia]
MSCNSTNGDPNSDSTSDIRETSLGKLDRRNVLLGIGGLYAFGAPIHAPDVTKCGVATVPEGVTPTNYFQLPFPDSLLRIRPAAHLVSKEYRAKYKKAIGLMKALPDDDPRNFRQQASVRCAYCNGADDQAGFPDLELQVHASWLFFPFHRFYAYFHERILAELINNPTSGLPYWSWDSPPGMQMPAIYADSTSTLYDEKRNAKHLPPGMQSWDLDYDFTKSTSPDSEIVANNLSIVYRQVVSGATIAKLFFGSPYRAGDQPDPGEVHIWTCLSDKPNENMGNFYTAGRDPIFFGHHANVDRMWTLWKAIRGKNRTEVADPDSQNGSSSTMLNAQLVRVKVRDCLDQLKLRYKDQDIPIPWLKKKYAAQSEDDHQKFQVGSSESGGTSKDDDQQKWRLPKPLNSVIRVEVPRPKKSRSKKEKKVEEEVLLIKGIELDRYDFVKFDVKPSNSEFAGSFVNVPHKHKQRMKTNNDESVIVTIVPRAGTDDGTIGAIEIEFVSD